MRMNSEVARPHAVLTPVTSLFIAMPQCFIKAIAMRLKH